MNNAPRSMLLCSTTTATLRVLLALVLAGGTGASAGAQGEIPSGTISSSGSGPFG